MKAKSKPNIKVILFDLGDVLIVDTAEVFESVFKYDRLSTEQKHKYLIDWTPTETGKKKVSALLQDIKEVFELPYSLKQIEKFFTLGIPIEPMWKIFNSILAQPKYFTAILTNNELGWPQKQLKHAGKFSKKLKIYNSAEIGYRKPDVRIFKSVLKKVGAKAQSVLFVDDKKHNIAAARKVGINTIHFTGDIPAVMRSLKKYGVDVKISKRK